MFAFYSKVFCPIGGLSSHLKNSCLVFCRRNSGFTNPEAHFGDSHISKIHHKRADVEQGRGEEKFQMVRLILFSPLVVTYSTSMPSIIREKILLKFKNAVNVKVIGISCRAKPEEPDLEARKFGQFSALGGTGGRESIPLKDTCEKHRGLGTKQKSDKGLNFRVLPFSCLFISFYCVFLFRT